MKGRFHTLLILLYQILYQAQSNLIGKLIVAVINYSKTQIGEMLVYIDHDQS